MANLNRSGPWARLANPPSPKELAERYGDGYYTDAWLAKEREEHARGLWDVPYAWRTGILGRPRTLLDWGCGPGHFVAWYNQRERAWGYDPYPFHKIDLASPFVFDRTEPLAQIARNLDGFDAVHMSLVLEHVYDPVGLLRELKAKWLKPGGRLLVIVPNEFNPLQRRLEKKWGPWYVDRDHLNYFTSKSLAWVLNEAGYETRHMGSTFPTELYSIAGDYRGTGLGNWLFRRTLEMQKVVGPRCFVWYEKLYARWGIGRELICLAQARR